MPFKRIIGRSNLSIEDRGAHIEGSRLEQQKEVIVISKSLQRLKYNDASPDEKPKLKSIPFSLSII